MWGPVRKGALSGTSISAIASSSTVTPSPGAVPEDELAVLDGEVERQAARRSEVLELGGHVVRDRGRGVDQAQGSGADRADRQVVGVGQGGHAQEVRDTPAGRGLDDVEGAGREERPELLEPGEVLPAGDRRPDRAPHGDHPGGVPAADRLLDPDEVHGAFQLRHVSHGLLARSRTRSRRASGPAGTPGWRRRGRRAPGTAWRGPGRRPARPSASPTRRPRSA